jgi:hypothetical protein
MKSRIWMWSWLTVTILAFSCDDDNSAIPSRAKLKSTLETDTWKVTYFFDSQDETEHFTGYVFTFNDDGTVAAAHDAQAVNGTWSVSSSTGNKTKLTLDFEVTEPFEDLNDDWDVIQFNNDGVQLQDIGGGSGGTDFLTFERIN